MPFAERQTLQGRIEFLVSLPIGCEEVAISAFGIPDVESEVAVLTGGIMQELRPAKTGVAPEEQNPPSGGPIGIFEACAISRLDFELPEDYKDSCPIFCSRSQVFQDNFDRGSLVCRSVGSIPIGYISRRVSHYPCCVINESETVRCG